MLYFWDKAHSVMMYYSFLYCWFYLLRSFASMCLQTILHEFFYTSSEFLSAAFFLHVLYLVIYSIFSFLRFLALPLFWDCHQVLPGFPHPFVETWKLSRHSAGASIMWGWVNVFYWLMINVLRGIVLYILSFSCFSCFSWENNSNSYHLYCTEVELDFYSIFNLIFQVNLPSFLSQLKTPPSTQLLVPETWCCPWFFLFVYLYNQSQSYQVFSKI